MKANFVVVIMCLYSIGAFAQTENAAPKVDSPLQQKFTLSTKNETAESGKYKHLSAININYDKEHNSYSLAITAEHNLNSYLEIKDQDDNVIFFKQVSLTPGKNIIALDTEDGAQTVFKISFQDMKNDTPAVYVYRLADAVVYSKK